ncbi:MAG: bifunctional oligoribonuclease/PAP phosphatase NrnA [Clostridia bacterium]|nr:bifunctional oligoribonuclease/PAP phosphatase NrnA [Clostridia bacterium]
MNLKECSEILKSLDNVYIYTHIHPDGDALGSAFGLSLIMKKMGKRSKVVCLDTLPAYLSFVWKREEEDFECEKIITVDVADMSLLGDFGDKKIDLVIDHHENNKVDCDKKLCLPEMAATGEIIYELSLELGVALDKNIAECLYTAIATDTGCFKFSNANAHTFKTVSELVQLAPEGNFNYLNDPLFITKSIKQMRFESSIIQNLKFFFDGRLSVSVVTKELISSHGLTDEETGGVEQLGKIPEGVELAVTLKEREEGFKVSMRSSDSIDSSLICAAFGGGGHKRAAGCFIKGDSDSITKTIISYVEENNIL